jgi:hypothetical protein
VTLGGNAFEIDFTDVDRPESGTIVYSTTLIDYGSLTGTYGALTTLGLGAGETAELFDDGELIGVTYTLTSIPEPGSFAMIAGFSALMMIALSRRR